MYAVEMLAYNEVHLLREHLVRHLSKSDQEDIVYHPLTHLERFQDQDWLEKNQAPLAKAVTEPNWARSWVIKHEGNIIAHSNLKGGNLESMLHRASLGIGIEKNFRHLGLGTKLMEAMIIWAKAHNIKWIDLHVHSHNLPAIKLYSKFKFELVGVTKDCFRVPQSIDDAHMCLEL